MEEPTRTINQVKGDRSHPASQAYTCNEAARINCYQNGRDPLTTLRDTHGGASILYDGGGGRDPKRTLVILDPRRSETAELAEIHLAVKPGTDVWVLTAILAWLVRNQAVNLAWLHEHTAGYERILEQLGRVDNVLSEEILTDHPARFRAMIVESSNPLHSLADSKTFREALGKPDMTVVIDVAMTETAVLADWALPAAPT